MYEQLTVYLQVNNLLPPAYRRLEIVHLKVHSQLFIRAALKQFGQKREIGR